MYACIRLSSESHFAVYNRNLRGFNSIYKVLRAVKYSVLLLLIIFAYSVDSHFLEGLLF